MAFPPKKKKAAGPKGPHTPIKEYPGQAYAVPAKGAKDPGASPLRGSAPAPPAASKSTSLVGPNAAAPEPKLSPEAEAARAEQGAVKVTTAKGPATAPPPDPRASYQVGEAEDNTPIFSFTTLASAAKQKGNPSALVQPAANSDLAGTESEDDESEDDAPVEEDEDEAPAKKSPFGKK
jgi:hypothetical protein